MLETFCVALLELLKAMLPLTTPAQPVCNQYPAAGIKETCIFLLAVSCFAACGL